MRVPGEAAGAAAGEDDDDAGCCVIGTGAAISKSLSSGAVHDGAGSCVQIRCLRLRLKIEPCSVWTL